MTATGALFIALLLLGALGLWLAARAEHGKAMRERAALFDEAAHHFPDSRVTVGEDFFPRLGGSLGDHRTWQAEIIADSLVTRRLPQLWLKLTLIEKEPHAGPTLGVLARPTGAEFYSLVQDLPERLEPPFEADVPMVMRGRNVYRRDLDRMAGVFRSLLADPGLKEAAVTPRGARIIRRVAEGGRGAHMVFRQMRFPVLSVPPELVATALAEAERLGEIAQSRETGTERKAQAVRSVTSEANCLRKVTPQQTVEA